MDPKSLSDSESLRREESPSLRSSGEVSPHSDDKLGKSSHSDGSGKTANPRKKNQWDDQIKAQSLFSSSSVSQSMLLEHKQSKFSSVRTRQESNKVESPASFDTFNDTNSVASTRSNAPQRKLNKRKNQESFSQDTTMSSINVHKPSLYSRFLSFILYFSLSNPKPKSKEIPNKFVNSEMYKFYFESGFKVELDAVLRKALEDTLFSNNYLLNFQMKAESALISAKGEEDNRKFVSEVRNDDVVLIIPEQDTCPIYFKALEENQVNWTIGLVSKRFQLVGENKQEIVNILINSDKMRELEDNRKYMVIVIENVTSLKRQILNLEKIDDFSFKDQILSPKAYKPSIEKNIPATFLETIQNQCNEKQRIAIEESINPDNEKILIHGPPGTGKTRIINLIISGLNAINSGAKILVCAESNSAIKKTAYEVLKNGIFDENGNKRNDKKFLLIEKWQKCEFGVEEEVKPSSEIEKSINSIKLNVILDKKLKDEGLYDPSLEIAKIITKREKLLEELQNERENRKVRFLKIELNMLSEELKVLKILKAKYFQKREQYTEEEIRSADIIFCTLSVSGSAIVSKNISPIDYLIIDEACQSLELSTLIPFQYNPKKVILIGDPKQLPATTISLLSKQNNYARSLFERMMNCGIKAILLTEQYRMDKKISKFISETFYDDQICTANSVISRPIPNWVYPSGLYFFNLYNSEEMEENHSKSRFNDPEAQFVLSLYAELRKKIKNTKASIGIISPYKGQVQLIEYLLSEQYGKSWKKHCEVSTVDGFQGREVDIVIFSAVRSGKIGFLKDKRRMNVAISRAKYAVYAIGNERCLLNDDHWVKLMDYCRNERTLKSCDDFQEVKSIFKKQ